MPQKNSTIQFGLSHEELFVILRYLKKDGMIGFENGLFSSLNEEKLTLVLSAAERSLFSRGFLQRNSDNRLMVNPVVFALVGTCLEPEISAMLFRNIPSSLEQQHFFHISRKMNVIHLIPAVGFHQFIAVEDRQNLAMLFVTTLSLTNHPVSEVPTGEIPMSALADARELAMKEGSQPACDLLEKNGLPRQSAIRLAETLQDPVANNTITFLDHPKNIIDGYAILQGKNSNWILIPSKDDAHDTVAISPLSLDKMIDQIKTGFQL